MVIGATLPRQGSEKDRKKLLFIDDDPIVVASLKLLFGRDFTTYDARNAEDGIHLFEQLQPDVVLLDLRLPGSDGIDILRAIRKNDSETPVVIMTGYATLASAEESMRLGAVDYVHKPFDALYLKSRILEISGVLKPVEGVPPDKQTLVKSLQRLNELELAENASSAFLHDAANPLTGLLTLTDMLRDNLKNREALPAEVLAETLENISDNARYIAALIEHWRAFSEPQTLVRHLVPLKDVIDLAVSLVKGKAVDKDVRILIHPEPEPAFLYINRFALARVLANLLQNAIEASPAHTGVVEIFSTASENRSEITVRDNGPGIAPSIVEKVFEPRATTKSKSMGLGLYIAQKIVQSTGGTLTAQNIQGKGAQFIVTMENAKHDRTAGNR